MIGIPLALAAFLTGRFQLTWRLVWIGAGTFVGSQLLHIPANVLIGRLFATGVLPNPMPDWQLLVSAAIGGLSAGLFEEVARYAAFRWWAREARSWRQAVLLGCGHGGAESVILGILTLYSLFSLFTYRGVDLTPWVPAEQLHAAQQQVDAYWSMPWSMSLLGAVERGLTIPIQIGFSVLVYQVFARRRLYWLAIAVLWHAAIDGVIAIYLGRLWIDRYPCGVYAVEAVLALATVASLALIFRLRSAEPSATAAALSSPLAMLAPPASPMLETVERLEDSRYHDPD
jgi:uncharacterized membrane protein YhfC